jgi:hypothetical protein
VQLIEAAFNSIGQQLPALVVGTMTGSQAVVLTSMFANATWLTYAFFAFLQSVPEPTSEIYIPTEVQGLIDSKSVKVKVLHTSNHWYGITYPEDKQQLVGFISECVENQLYPSNLWE